MTAMRLFIFSQLFLMFGVASIAYGLARWQIVPDVLSKQEKHFAEFHASRADGSAITQEQVAKLHQRIMMSGGRYPGWPQAICPCGIGLMLIAGSCYLRVNKTHEKHRS